jgi:hypothetical protein
MKRKIPEILSRKYKLPSKLTDFQLSLYVHLIEWKWKYLTKVPGRNAGREYDAILPKEFKEELHPLYRPLVDHIKENHKFKFHKHFGHMASSQAACINLFTPILKDEKIANAVLPKINPLFSRLATDRLENGFRFEFWDESNPLSDHTDAAGTDSDVAIAYYDTRQRLSLWLIEHKLTEDEFTTCGGYHSKGNKVKSNCTAGAKVVEDNSKCYYQYHCNYNYWRIANSSDLYDMTVLLRNKRCPFIGGTNQLWRNQLLGHAIKKKGEYQNVHLSVVHHPANHELQETIDEYKEMLRSKQTFSVFSSKQIIDESLKIRNDELQKWAKWYFELYRIG